MKKSASHLRVLDGPKPSDARFVEGLPMREYQRDAGLSRSALQQIAKSPLHLQHYLRHGIPDTPSMKKGRVLHTALLEEAKLDDQVAVWEGGRCAGKAWEAFKRAHPGKEIIKRSDADDIDAMIESFHACPAAAEFLTGATIEPSAFWQKGELGIRCKARPDLVVSDTTLADVKTAEDNTRAGFARAVAEYGYHRQAAWYLDGMMHATGRVYDDFVFIVLEKKAPWSVALYRLMPDDIAMGRAENEQLFEQYEACVKSGLWPGPGAMVQTISLPGWARP